MELEQSASQFAAKNAQLLAIAYQSQAEAQTTVEHTAVSFPVLADVKHEVASRYEVFNTLGDGVATPAIFVVNPAGNIVWSYIAQDFADRPTTQQILDNLPF